MRDRLIKLLNTDMSGCDGDYAEELADYLIANGVILPPCKVADTLYEPTDRGTISEYEVLAVRVDLFSTFVEWKIKEGIVWRSVHEINSNEIGKTVFLSREEAERVLKERKRNGG